MSGGISYSRTSAIRIALSAAVGVERNSRHVSTGAHCGALKK
jgi:hypothetical protein